MNRNDFGLWGLDLSSDDFARALAALGVLWSNVMVTYGPSIDDVYRLNDLDSMFQPLAEQVEQAEREARPMHWQLPFRPERLSDGPSPSARLLADAWGRLIENSAAPRRLEVDPRYVDEPVWINRWYMDDPFWLVEQLTQRTVEITSVYIDLLPNHFYEIGWDWPLRVGFLPDPASVQLRQQLEQNHWFKRLWEPVTLALGYDACNLLLLPFDLHGALMTLLEAQVPVRTDCVLVLGVTRISYAAAQSLLAAIYGQIYTGGIGLPSIPSRDRVSWFNTLIDALAHDQPLDAALFTASRQAQAAQANNPGAQDHHSFPWLRIAQADPMQGRGQGL